MAKEIKGNSSFDWHYFAAMPPLSALRLLFVVATTQGLKDPEGNVISFGDEQPMISFVDVKKAHLWSPATRKVWVELPAEAGAPQGTVGRLLRSMYGCRDASLNWETTVRKVLTSIGFVSGKGNPCL